MSTIDYDTALGRLRTAPVDPPPYSDVRRSVDAMRDATRGELGARRRQARIALTVAMLGFTMVPLGRLVWALRFGIIDAHYLLLGTSAGAAVAMAIIAVGVWLVGRPSFGAQLMGRAIATSSLVVGVLLAVSSSGIGAAGGAVVAVGCAAALLRLDRTGLEAREPGHPFSPVAYRSFLALALIMAFADAQTLLFSAVVQITTAIAYPEAIEASEVLGTTVAGLAMVINVWGLYRLRVWAMFANIVTNLVVAYLALTGALGLTLSVSFALAVTASIQLLLPVPVLAAALGDRGAGRWWVGWGAMRIALVTLAGGATLYAVPHSLSVRSQDEWVEIDRHGSRTVAPLPTGGPVARAAWTGELPGIDMSGQRLRRLSVHRARLDGSSFRGADLRAAWIVQSSLIDVDLRDADLRHAVVGSSDLRRADLRGADLSDARLGASDLGDARLDGARFVRTVCPDQQLSDAVGGTCIGHERMPPATEAAEAIAGRYVAEGPPVPALGHGLDGIVLTTDDDGYLRWRHAPMAPQPDGSLVVHDGFARTVLPLRDAGGAVIGLEVRTRSRATVRLRRVPDDPR